MQIRILIFIFMCLPLAASAQLDWGMKAGLNLNTIHVSDDLYDLDDYGWQPGIHVGGFGSMELSDKLVAGAEVLFSQRGFHYDGARHVLNYLTVPVFVGYEIFPALYIHAGISASLLVGYRIDGVKLKDLAEDACASIFGGMAYRFDENWLVSARYYAGISPYLRGDVDYVNGTDRVRYFTRTIELSVGFRVF